MKKRFLRESKAVAELAVTKCLTGAKLTPEEMNEVCDLGESDLMRDYGCDLYMAETVKLHAKREMMRLRAQNKFTPIEGLWNKTGYPEKPFTRTEYIKESRKRLNEDIHSASYDNPDRSHSSPGGRMLDYGHVKSDSDEGRMMKQSLRDVAVDAYRLHQMIEDGDDLPQWCQYKAAQAQQMIGSVRNYLEYKLERGGEDMVGEEEMFDPDEMSSDFGVNSSDADMPGSIYDIEEELADNNEDYFEDKEIKGFSHELVPDDDLEFDDADADNNYEDEDDYDTEVEDDYNEDESEEGYDDAEVFVSSKEK